MVYTLLMRASGIIAVPLILTHFDGNTYAAWVVAGALIGSQGLFDLGAGAVITRYAATEASRNSRAGVVGVLKVAGQFYLVLSVLVFAIIGAVVGLTSGTLTGDGSTDTDVLFVCSAAAFALTNARIVFAAVAQGCGRVDRSFQLQSIEPVVFLLVLSVGIAAGAGFAIIGVAWIAAAASSSAALGGACVGYVRGLGDVAAERLRLGEVARLGGGWQVSSWADFASFQAPRVLAGLFLPVANLVALDIALRLAQIVVFPLFAVFPIVVPLVTRMREQVGEAAARGLVLELERVVAAAAVVGVALMLPLLIPAAVVWTGLPAASMEPPVYAAVMAGAAAHASTGVLTSTLLALGTVRSVIAYKTFQLGLALVLVSPASLIDARLTALAILISLAVPALWFTRTALRVVGIGAPWGGAGPATRLWSAAIAAGLVTWGAVELASPAGALAQLVAGGAVGALALLACAARLGLLPHEIRARVAALELDAGVEPVQAR